MRNLDIIRAPTKPLYTSKTTLPIQSANISIFLMMMMMRGRRGFICFQSDNVYCIKF